MLSMSSYCTTKFGCLFLLSCNVSTMVSITFRSIHQTRSTGAIGSHISRAIGAFPFSVFRFTIHQLPFNKFFEVGDCQQDMVNRTTLTATPGRNATL